MNPEKSIRKLVADVLEELERLHYVEGTRTGYRRFYRRLIGFADRAGEAVYSESLGNRFLQSSYAFDLDNYSVSLHRSFRNEARFIRVLGDYQLHGAILRRRATKPHIRGLPSSPRRSTLTTKNAADEITPTRECGAVSIERNCL